MARKSDLIPLPEEIKTPKEELAVLAELQNTVYFKVIKRVVRRYEENLKNQSFTLREEDPHFAIKHTRYVEQAVGMNLLLKVVESAAKELRKEDGDND